MTLSVDSSVSRPSADRPQSADPRPDDHLQAGLHAALSTQLPELAAKWVLQWQTAISRDALGIGGRDEQVASDVVTVLLAGLAVGDEEPGASISVGLRFGAQAFEQGVSLYHTEWGVDLLAAMVMSAMETATAGTVTQSGGVTDGIRLAHRLQRRVALLSRAATHGYMQAHGKALRDQFRHLRHDLRNPLGTIKSVLALMDDESVSSEARANPNFRSMAKRNARSLEEMIADRLSDDAAPLSPISERETSLYAIAHAVHETLSTEAERRGILILVNASDLRGRFDATGLELLLESTLLAALQESRMGEQLHLDFEETAGKRVALRLSCESGLAPIANRDTLERLTTLASQIGVSASFSDRVQISVPIRAGIPEVSRTMERERPVLHDAGELGSGEPPHDFRSARDGDHGQASVL